jgi:hypothetical protein
MSHAFDASCAPITVYRSIKANAQESSKLRSEQRQQQTAVTKVECKFGDRHGCCKAHHREQCEKRGRSKTAKPATASAESPISSNTVTKLTRDSQNSGNGTRCRERNLERDRDFDDFMLATCVILF